MKENQRIRLTKMCLRESLLRLLSQKGIHKLSVREICEEAGINRTTFYKYYGSQYDLLKDMEDEALAQIEEHLKSSENDSDIGTRQVEALLTQIELNVELFRLLANNTTDTDFPRRLFSLPMIQQMLEARLHARYGESEINYIYIFVVNGGFNMIKEWINKDERESPKKIAALLLNVVTQVFL